MTDKKFEPVNLVPWLIALVLLLMLAESRADVDPRQPNIDVRQSNDMNNQTAGNVTTGDSLMNNESKAYAFAHSLGDVDINQCIVTKQTGTFVISWQGYDYNLWCMGEVFDAKGLYRMGAVMRCDIPAIRVHFTDDAACLAANEVSPEIVVAPTLAFTEHEEAEEEHDELLMEQQQMIIDLQAKYDNLPRATRPLLSDKQRAALKEVLAE